MNIQPGTRADKLWRLMNKAKRAILNNELDEAETYLRDPATTSRTETATGKRASAKA